MNTLLRFAFLSLAVLAARASVHAGDSVEEPSRGHVLIFDSERTLEGDIERHGDHYVVSRIGGGMTTVPGDRVVYLAQDLPDALHYLRSQANLNDADERLRLAQWCHLHGLKEQAMAEVKAATALEPENERARQLLAYLKKANEIQASPPAKALAKTQSESASILNDGPEVTIESLSLFSSKTQPILMNACAKCHAGDQSGHFRLKQTFEAGNLAQRTTRDNLTAVLAQVNFQDPASSPLLIKAQSAHGSMSQTPFTKRQMGAYKTLENWVFVTAGVNAHVKNTPAETPVTSEFTADKTPGGPKADIKPEGIKSTDAKPAPKDPMNKADAAEAKKGPVDPFDPILFNKQAHPDR